MKHIVFALGVMLLVFAVAISAQAQTASVEQELIKLEKEWYDAEIKLDVAFIDQVVADDFIWTGPNGNVSTKAQLLAELKSGGSGLTSAVIDEIKVRVYGDAAVVIGGSTEKGQSKKGEAFTEHIRWTDTWIKQAGRWRCVAEHISLIPKK